VPKPSETFCGPLFAPLLDILGPGSGNIEPVKVEDLDIVFGEEIIVTTTPSAEGKLIIILCKSSNPLKRATVLAQGGSCSKQKPISKGGRALSYVANLEYQFYIRVPSQVLKPYSKIPVGTSCWTQKPKTPLCGTNPFPIQANRSDC